MGIITTQDVNLQSIKIHGLSWIFNMVVDSLWLMRRKCIPVSNIYPINTLYELLTKDKMDSVNILGQYLFKNYDISDSSSQMNWTSCYDYTVSQLFVQ